MTTDAKVAYLARDYLYMWMNDITRFYWYAWDNAQWGTLYSGSILPTGTAYEIMESWLVGSTHDANNCSESGISTWTCTLTLQDKTPAIIVWNAAATHSQTVPAGYMHYRTVDDATVHDVSAGVVSVGAKPILVSP